MRTTAVILGVSGAVFGLIGWLFAAAFVQPWNQQTLIGFLSIWVGLGGAILIRSLPVLAALLLFGAGIVGFLAIGAFWLVSLPLMLIAGVLALLTLRQEPLPA